MNPTDYQWKHSQVYKRLLEQARPAILAGQKCPVCTNTNGADTKRLSDPTGRITVDCPCVELRIEQKANLEQADLWKQLSKLTDKEEGYTFEQLVPPANATPKQWAGVVAAREALKRLIASPFDSKWMILQGPYGSGKTHLTICTYKQLRECAMHISTVDIKDGIHTWTTNGHLAIFQEALRNVPVLFIDDLGKEHDAAFTFSIIAGVINHRWNHGTRRPTIVSTNLDMPTIASRYGAMGDRLIDVSLTVVYPVVLPQSMRQTKDVKHGNVKS